MIAGISIIQCGTVNKSHLSNAQLFIKNKKILHITTTCENINKSQIMKEKNHLKL